MDAPNESSSFNFQRIIIIIAIIALIASMIFIGYALYDQSSAISWPPEKPKCPDFWTVDASGNCINGTQPKTPCEYNGIPAGTHVMPKCPP